VDSGLNEFNRTFQITVVDVDITSTPVTLAVPGEVYEYNITVTDVPETLTLSAPQKPTWATITSTGKNKARLRGTPPANAVSSNVTIQLRDGAAVIDQQQYTIEINRRPVVSPFLVEGPEDVKTTIGTDRFLAAYSDPESHALTEVQITQLPRHGNLSLGESVVTSGQNIPLASLGLLAYTPHEEYSGLDTVYYKAMDTFSYSVDESYFHFAISPVNDAPVIETIETEPLPYDIGRELAQIFTTQFSAREPEGDLITSAVIGFLAPNFNSVHDLLEFSNTSAITGNYDEEAGILTLTGSATVEEYQEAIRTITYTFRDLDDIILLPRTLYITLSDGVNVSEPKERVISLVYDFVELQIPNVFTPDGNGRNDIWKVGSTTGIQQYSDAIIRIFDKRGKMIFETTGLDNGWDGTFNGAPLPVETYFYAIDLKYGKVRYTGTVTILREAQ
jgi:gliding motility-associated-like protein